MNKDLDPHSAVVSVFLAPMLGAAGYNRKILAAYDRISKAPEVRRTHHFHDRFENTYVDLEMIPEFKPVLDMARQYAEEILGRSDLKLGFWFNEMQPGDQTSLHSHEEDDELLSCVYYIRSPENSGRLILRSSAGEIPIVPEEGMFVFFSPDVMHRVEKNHSRYPRLSVALNFGPA